MDEEVNKEIPQIPNSDTDNSLPVPVATNNVCDVEENVDSGISADKTESNSSDDPSPSTLKKENESAEVNDQPSTSSGATSAPTISRRLFKTRGRNYRLYCKRVNPINLDSDDDDDEDVVMDSDDCLYENGGDRDRNSDSLPIVEDPPALPQNTGESVKFPNETESDSEGSDDNDSNMNSDSDDLSDEDMDSSSQSEPETPFVLLKKKPPHRWSIVKELNQRQLGYTVGKRHQGRGGEAKAFEQKFYGSLHSVERLELICKLNGHGGCVNCIHFHPEGRFLVSGSDDLNIVIWDWAIKKPIHTVKTGHKSNVFQCKFMYFNSNSQMNIATCARDGQVRYLQIPPYGGPPIKRKLTQHSEAAHKLHISPAEPHIIISSGEDGQVLLSDLREEATTKLLTAKSGNSTIPLYSVAGHPLDINELCVAGRNRMVRVYDRRKAGKNARTVKTFCPEFFLKSTGPNAKLKRFRQISLYITHAIYNHNGSEILASYNDDDIYLFDTKLDADPVPPKTGYTYRYAGHRNADTFKGVSFFGPQSEFVVSGSDCGNIFIWDKKTEAIVQWMAGDEEGTVNCIECHSQFPIMATSGLDLDVKIWVPSNEREPKLDGLRDTVIENNKGQLRAPLFDEYSLIPNLLSIFNRATQNRTDSDEDDDSDGTEGPYLPSSSIQCQPQ